MEARIGEVTIDMTVTETVGSLGPEEVKRLVALVLEQVRRAQEHQAAQEEDTHIGDRTYRRN